MVDYWCREWVWADRVLSLAPAAAVSMACGNGIWALPLRLVLSLPEGDNLLAISAADDELAITKLVTVHPGNARRELPTTQGEVIVMEARTGTRLGILDGAAVTARRTAALSLLAAQTLAPRPDGPLLIVGAGTQVRSHLEAFRGGLGVSKVFTRGVWEWTHGS